MLMFAWQLSVEISNLSSSSTSKRTIARSIKVFCQDASRVLMFAWQLSVEISKLPSYSTPKRTIANDGMKSMTSSAHRKSFKELPRFVVCDIVRGRGSNCSLPNQCHRSKIVFSLKIQSFTGPFQVKMADSPLPQLRKTLTLLEIGHGWQRILTSQLDDLVSNRRNKLESGPCSDCFFETGIDDACSPAQWPLACSEEHCLDSLWHRAIL